MKSDKTIVLRCLCGECEFNNPDKKECTLHAIEMSDGGYCEDYNFYEEEE